MKEVEIKIRNIEKEKLIKKLESLKARKVFAGRVIDYRFDTPQRTLSKQGKALRIRQKGRHIYLNLKGKKKTVENMIDREEMGVKIMNLKAMKRMLGELGYVKIFELNKFRTEYKLLDVIFDIDEYVGMDPILEIESDSAKKVQEQMKVLEINKKDIGRIYIREILAAKKRYDEEKILKRKEY